MAFCYPPTQQRAEPGNDMARDKRMTVMVEAEFMDEVKEAARNRRMKMSEWIRLVVENELRTEKERRS